MPEGLSPDQEYEAMSLKRKIEEMDETAASYDNAPDQRKVYNARLRTQEGVEALKADAADHVYKHLDQYAETAKDEMAADFEQRGDAEGEQAPGEIQQ